MQYLKERQPGKIENVVVVDDVDVDVITNGEKKDEKKKNKRKH